MPEVTSARISALIKDVEDGSLALQPAFQRRLVWTNVVKDNFLETVLLGLPFPEVFIATGTIDTRTMERKNLLVDGQQRISTLREYVQSSPDLSLTKVKPYAELTEDEKAKFLDYTVAVRDLGTITPQQLKEIFSRINSTDYSLRSIERLNAMFSGAYKKFCEELSVDPFFNRHNVFSMADIRRMRDLDFGVILTTTLLSTYYQRDGLNREYLHRYNDKFPAATRLRKQFATVFQFIEDCAFDRRCRVWKKTDLMTLIVELNAILNVDKQPLDVGRVKAKLEEFYSQVGEMFAMKGPDEEIEARAPNRNVFRYLKAATKATNDKYARVDRAEVIAEILESTMDADAQAKRRDEKKPKVTKKKAKTAKGTKGKS